MRRVGVIGAAVIATLVGICAPAAAVTVGPDGFDGGTSYFDATGAFIGPIGDDDPWSGTVTIAGHSGCDMYGTGETGCWIDPELVVGQKYDAVVSESGGGFWFCSIYSEDVCHWDDPYSSKHEYVFTYTGKTQKLTEYYAPVSISIKKKKAHNPHRWNVSCGVARAGKAYPGVGVRVQWRDKKHPRWQNLGTWKANSSGKAAGWVRWSGIAGTLRCATDGDWHSRVGASRGVRLWTR